jgi:hypothetical protein
VIAMVGVMAFATATAISPDKWVARHTMFACHEPGAPDNFWMLELQNNESGSFVRFYGDRPVDKVDLKLLKPFKSVEYDKTDAGQTWLVDVEGSVGVRVVRANIALSTKVSEGVSAKFELKADGKNWQITDCKPMPLPPGAEK